MHTMSFNEFIAKIKSWLASEGDKTNFKFTCDEERGMYRAQHPEYDDYFITVPRGGTTGTANWHGHTARFSFS